MARGKKAVKELSPEEKLQQALVPVEEQPYPIPENWCWVKLHFVCEYLKAGGDKPASFVEKKDKEHLIPVVANGIENEGIIGFTNIGQISAGTVSVSGRGTIGYSFLREYEYVPVVRLIVIKPRKNLLPHYLKFIFDVFEEKGTGSSIPQLTVPMIKDKIIPLPPVPEQLRIVSRIESLFAKLDEAKEKAQAVVDGFELRKSAILYKAFTGELTERWRKEHGRSNADWRVARFDEVAEIKSNLVDPADYQNFPHIAPDNIEKKTGVLLEYHTIAEDGVKSGKHLFHTGQILYSKIRPYLSKVVIVDFDGLCSADMYPVNAKENSRYLWYYLLSDEFLEQASNAGSRSVLPKINQKELSKVMVRITSLEEQQAIAIILDDIFKNEQQAKEAAEAVLSQIDTMKKAILARVFRGELGTNDPAEESAVELIKAVL